MLEAYDVGYYCSPGKGTAGSTSKPVLKIGASQISCSLHGGELTDDF